MSEYIYFAGCERFIKVGVAGAPHKRMKSMQTGNPFPIYLVGFIKMEFRTSLLLSPYDVERRIHRYWKHRLVRGEWFDASLKDVADLFKNKNSPVCYLSNVEVQLLKNGDFTTIKTRAQE